MHRRPGILLLRTNTSCFSEKLPTELNKSAEPGAAQLAPMTPVPTIAIRFIGLFNGTICPPCKIANLLFLHVPCHCRTCDTQCKWLKEWDIADKRDLKTSQCSYRSGNPLSRASRLPPEKRGRGFVAVSGSEVEFPLCPKLPPHRTEEGPEIGTNDA